MMLISGSQNAQYRSARYARPNWRTAKRIHPENDHGFSLALPSR